MKYSDKLSFLMYVNNYRTDDLAKQLRVKVNTLDTWLFFILYPTRTSMTYSNLPTNGKINNVAVR